MTFCYKAEEFQLVSQQTTVHLILWVFSPQALEEISISSQKLQS